MSAVWEGVGRSADRVEFPLVQFRAEQPGRLVARDDRAGQRGQRRVDLPAAGQRAVAGGQSGGPDAQGGDAGHGVVAGLVGDQVQDPDGGGPVAPGQGEPGEAEGGADVGGVAGVDRAEEFVRGRARAGPHLLRAVGEGELRRVLAGQGTVHGREVAVGGLQQRLPLLLPYVRFAQRDQPRCQLRRHCRTGPGPGIAAAASTCSWAALGASGPSWPSSSRALCRQISTDRSPSAGWASGWPGS